MAFNLPGWSPFKKVPDQYINKEYANKQPLFDRREPGEARDVTKLTRKAKSLGVGKTGLEKAFLYGVPAVAVGQTIKRGVKHGLLGKYGLGKAALGALKTNLPMAAAIHFGGKLAKGIYKRKVNKKLGANSPYNKNRK